ncbi:MAG TPA: hypothetical protein VD867_15550 [Burkholderiales bacterium]|nr:hypothetical protein [Burkholderiales bacterium]
MITWQRIKAEVLKARIAYHRRQAESYGKTQVRSHKRDDYGIWMRNMAMRHEMKAHHLERQLSSVA